jgi:glycosidase
MNYPLAEATMGFAAGSHLDRQVIAEHVMYRRSVVPRDGASFGEELERLLALYASDVTAVMLNLLGSHDAPRIRTVCGGDIAGVRLSTLLQMTLPGAPCIYYGDEIGLEGHQDPDNRRAFPWDRAQWDGELHGFVRSLAWLRRRHRALRDGQIRVLGSSGGTIAYLRADEVDAFLVACNAGDAAEALRLDVAGTDGEPAAEIRTDGGGSTAVTHTVEGGGRWLQLEVPPRTGLVLRMRAAHG